MAGQTPAGGGGGGGALDFVFGRDPHRNGGLKNWFFYESKG